VGREKAEEAPTTGKKKKGRPKLTEAQKKKAANALKKKREACAPEDKPLTVRERRFVDELKLDPGNVAAAMRRAGYSEQTAHKAATRFIQKPHIARAINREIGDPLAQMGVNADTVLCRMAMIAMTDTTQIVRYTKRDVHNPGKRFAHPRQQILDDEDWTPGAHALFAGIKEKSFLDGSTEVEIKTKDQLTALKIMCEHLGVLDRANRRKSKPYPEQQQALDDILAGKKTPKESALYLEREGVPVPETILKLLARPEPEIDPLEGLQTVDPEEMWQRRKARLAEIEAQKKGLDATREEVAQIKAELGDKVEHFKQAESQ
jgi:hypothetical protein